MAAKGFKEIIKITKGVVTRDFKAKIESYPKPKNIEGRKKLTKARTISNLG